MRATMLGTAIWLETTPDSVDNYKGFYLDGQISSRAAIAHTTAKEFLLNRTKYNFWF